MSLYLTIFLALVVAYLIVRPHLCVAEAGQSSGKNAFGDQQERMVQVLHDLDLDFATQKISLEEYQDTKARLEGEFAELLKKMDP